MRVPKMDATATATRKAAASVTTIAPPTLSTGRLRAFRPPSHRPSRDIRQFVPRTLTFMIATPRLPNVAGRLDLDDRHLTWQCEQAIRNYDPCISCATHFLDLTVDRA
jgi:hypothetical protein